MRAPLSTEIAKVIKNGEKARALIKAVLESRENNGIVMVRIGGQTKYYRPISTIRRKV